MSCNGCRVLRKGCTDDCTIRPCLEWIKSADAQANATMFLAKFYGRAGLLNLISTGPEHLRPAIFRSLLYEACGRIINPVYGSVGLLWSGNWARCQSKVDAVLKGTSQFTSYPGLPTLKYSSCDIRHIKKSASSTSQDHKVASARHGSKYKRVKAYNDHVNGSNTGLWIYPTPIFEDTIALSHNENIISMEDESNFSVETIEESLVVTEAKDGQKMWNFSDPVVERMRAADANSAIELDLSLGLQVNS